MNAFALGTFTSSARIKAFHYVMFHGRYDADAPDHPTSHDLSTDMSRHIPISRNGTTIPDIFEPRALVISHAVARKMESFPNVGFRPVIFTKLVDYPYRAGDFSFYEDNTPQVFAHAGKFLNRLPDVPELHKRAGKYFEMIVPRLQDIAPRYDDTTDFKIQVPGSALYERTAALSKTLLRDYPAVWKGYNIFSEEVFAVLKPHIDWDYFAVVEISV